MKVHNACVQFNVLNFEHQNKKETNIISRYLYFQIYKNNFVYFLSNFKIFKSKEKDL